MINLGKYKMLLSRLTGYVGLASFTMVLYLFVKGEPLGITWIIWVILIIISFVLLLIFDFKYIFKKEADFGFENTPRLVEMESKVEKILSILEEKK